MRNPLIIDRSNNVNAISTKMKVLSIGKNIPDVVEIVIPFGSKNEVIKLRISVSDNIAKMLNENKELFDELTLSMKNDLSQLSEDSVFKHTNKAIETIQNRHLVKLSEVDALNNILHQVSIGILYKVCTEQNLDFSYLKSLFIASTVRQNLPKNAINSKKNFQLKIVSVLLILLMFILLYILFALFL